MKMELIFTILFLALTVSVESKECKQQSDCFDYECCEDTAFEKEAIGKCNQLRGEGKSCSIISDQLKSFDGKYMGTCPCKKGLLCKGKIDIATKREFLQCVNETRELSININEKKQRFKREAPGYWEVESELDETDESQSGDTGTNYSQETNLSHNPDTDLSNNPDTDLSHDPDTDLSHNQDPSLGHNQVLSLSNNQYTDLNKNQDTALSHDQGSSLSHNQDTDLSHNQETDFSHNQDTGLSHNQDTGFSQDAGLNYRQSAVNEGWEDMLPITDEDTKDVTNEKVDIENDQKLKLLWEKEGLPEWNDDNPIIPMNEKDSTQVHTIGDIGDGIFIEGITDKHELPANDMEQNMKKVMKNMMQRFKNKQPAKDSFEDIPLHHQNDQDSATMKRPMSKEAILNKLPEKGTTFRRTEIPEEVDFEGATLNTETTLSYSQLLKLLQGMMQSKNKPSRDIFEGGSRPGKDDASSILKENAKVEDVFPNKQGEKDTDLSHIDSSFIEDWEEVTERSDTTSRIVQSSSKDDLSENSAVPKRGNNKQPVKSEWESNLLQHVGVSDHEGDPKKDKMEEGSLHNDKTVVQMQELKQDTSEESSIIDDTNSDYMDEF